MKRALAFLGPVTLILSACAPVAAPTAAPATRAVPLPATPAPTATSTPTPAPTATATATPTPIPTLQVGELSVPDPRAVAPELFNPLTSDAPILPFVNAMQMAGIEVAGEQVAQGITFQQLTDADGNPFIVGVYHLDPDPSKQGETLEGPIPLFIYENEWNTILPKDFGSLCDVPVWILFGGWAIRDPGYFGGSKYTRVAEGFNGVYESFMDFQSPIEKGRFDLHRERERMNFYIPDLTFKYSQQHGKLLWLGNILGGNEEINIPKWLKEIRNKDEFLEVIRGHIEAIITRYRGNNVSYTLVNEYFGSPFTNDPTTRFWKRKANSFGISDLEFMNFVYSLAKEVDPSSVLIFNEYGMEIPGSYNYVAEKDSKIYELLKRCKDKGIPIDAVGFQMHLYGRDFVGNKAQNMFASFRSQIRRYKSLGLDVRISELDVRIDDMSDISLEERLKLQAYIYDEIVRIAIQEGVTAINIWGIADHDSWLNNPDITGADSKETRPLLFDHNNDPKPAYYGLLQGLFLSKIKK